MQIVQELKFAYDTRIDQDVEDALETLVFLLQSKDLLIKDHVRPIRNTSLSPKKELTCLVDSV